MKKKKIIMLSLPLAALILELLPGAVSMRFANPDGEPFITKTSYFDTLPFGYGNFGPMMTAVLTCIIVLLFAVYLFKENEKLPRVAVLLSAMAAATSLLPLAAMSYTVIGFFITLCFAVEVFYVMRSINH